MPVTLNLNGQTWPAEPGRSLFEQAEAHGIEVPTSCRKQGKCKECMLEIVEGMEALSPPTPAESHLRGNFRLACQTYVAEATETAIGNAPAERKNACDCAAGDRLIRCHTLRRGAMRIVGRAFHSSAGSDSGSATGGFDLDPAVTRDGDRVLLETSEGKVEIARAGGPLGGLALDLGTTTVVVRLFDLETGECLADASFENPQRFGGAEVMSRIAYDTEHPGKLLMRTLAGYLSHAIEKFPVAPQSIYEMVVVGNSTMRDLFFRQNVYSIGQSPYRSRSELEREAGRRASTSLEQSGRRSLLPIHPRARVYGGPIISGHVGADAAAAMLAVNLAREERRVAIMDIGTNTELIVGNRHRLLAASCPAGPAFEGGSIACGMPALEGAIEDVSIGADGVVELRVIGDAPPAGICGSGLVAALGELLRTGRMSELGRFTRGASRFTLYRAPDNAATGEIYLLESDINELAQAKGANVAGLHVVFGEYGLGFGDIDVFYLAGGFGRHIDIEAARRIGLVPDIAPAKFVQAGNLAIEGASMALLSRRRRRELEALALQAQHQRLETHARFFDYFVEGCQFKPVRPLSPCPA